MAEISKRKRSLGRRSSILKRALADIDVNDKTEFMKSKRVSFAETCCVKEFVKDSPQTVKAVEPDDGNISGESSLLEADHATGVQHPQSKPLADNKEGISFMGDEWETTTDVDGFYESTRILDRGNTCVFGEAGGLNVSAITQGENSMFYPNNTAISTPHGSGADCVPPSHVSKELSQLPDGHVTRQAPFYESQKMECGLENNRTVIFDDQDDASMDLTLMNTTRSFHDEPVKKISAHDFLSKFKSTGSNQTERRALARSFLSTEIQDQENKTVLFNEQDGGTMDLILTETSVASTSVQPFQKISAHDFLSSLKAGNIGDNKEERAGASTKLKVGTHQKNSKLASSTVFTVEDRPLVAPSLQNENEEDNNMTMEMTCQDLYMTPVTLPRSVANASSQPSQPLFTARVPPHEMIEKPDATETLKFTACVDTGQIVLDASGSVKASVEGNNSKSPGRMRSALVDITARYSGSTEVLPSSPDAVKQSSLQVKSHPDGLLTSKLAMRPGGEDHIVADAHIQSSTPVLPIPDSSSEGQGSKLLTQNHRGSLPQMERDHQQSSLLHNSVHLTDHLSKVQDQAVHFRTEATGGDMEITGAGSDSTNDQVSKPSLSEPGNSLQCLEAHCKSLSNKSVNFDKEETAANMSLTCATLTQSMTHGKHQIDKSVVFDREETAANMDLTCPTLPRTLQNRSRLNRTITGREENLAASTHSGQYDNSKVNKSVMFDKEDTAANMSLTCATLTHSVPHGKSKSNKCVMFDKEETVANLSLTCTNLTHSGPYLESLTNKNASLRDDRTAENTNTNCSASSDEQVVAKDSELFKQHETQAEMNPASAITVTSAKPLSANVLTSKDTAATLANISEVQIPCGDTAQTHGESHARRQLEKTIVFAAEERGANMSMTCTLFPGERAHFDPAESPHPQEPRNTDKTVTFGSGHTQSGEKTVVSHRPEQTLPLEEKDSEVPLQPNRSRDLISTFTPQRIHSEDTGLRSSKEQCVDTALFSTSADTQPALQVSLDTDSGAGVDQTDSVFTSSAETQKKESSALGPYESLKRKLQNSDMQGPKPKTLCPEGGVHGKHSDVSTETTMSQRQQISSNSSYNGGPDIFGETIPVFSSTASNTSAVSGISTSMMSVSVTNDTTGSSMMSIYKSFVDKQAIAEKPASFLQLFELLGIPQFELKGKVSRRSSGINKPDLACETVEDQLNVAFVVKPECEVQTVFHNTLLDMAQREEVTSKKLEGTLVKQITELNLVAEAEQSVSLAQQIRSLLAASKEFTQAVWKRQKAQLLSDLAQKIENQQQDVSKDLAVMTTSIEHMVALTNNVNSNISRLHEQLESFKNQVSIRKQNCKQSHKQQQLQHKHSDLDSLQGQVSENKSLIARLDQEEAEVELKRKHARQHYETCLEKQQQLSQTFNTLSTLHSLNCWRPVRVKEHCLDFVLLDGAVLLSVVFSGKPESLQPVCSISVTSCLKEGSEPWAELATQLTVDCLSSCSQHMVDTFSTRQHVPQMLDEVTRVVGDITALAVDVKLAFLKYRLTITGKQLMAEVWNTERLRKVAMSTEVYVDKSLHSPFTWHADIIMGDISQCQLQKTIAQVEGGRTHFTDVLQAVQTLLSN